MSMPHTATITRSRRVLCAALLGTALLAAALPATSFAKEIVSGGVAATGGAVACSPISSLTVKADPKVGETGLASSGVQRQRNAGTVVAESDVLAEMVGDNDTLQAELMVPQRGMAQATAGPRNG